MEVDRIVETMHFIRPPPYNQAQNSNDLRPSDRI